MNLFGMLEINGSALTSERQRTEVVTSNMANVETTRTPQGGPYQRQLVVFRARRMPQFPLMLAGGLPSTGERHTRGSGSRRSYSSYRTLPAGESRRRCQRVCCLSGD